MLFERQLHKESTLPIAENINNNQESINFSFTPKKYKDKLNPMVDSLIDQIKETDQLDNEIVEMIDNPPMELNLNLDLDEVKIPIIEQRLSICRGTESVKACQYYDKTKIPLLPKKVEVCGSCGCFLALRVYTMCPAGKW